MRATGAVALLLLAGPATAAAADAPNARLAQGPRVLDDLVAANGAFARGLEGWTALGRTAPAALGGRVRLDANTTLVSPPLAIPVAAQALTVRARAPGGGGVLAVRARPAGGGPEIPLGVVEPDARMRGADVSAAPIAGRVVAIVLDPVPVLGRPVEVAGLGPLRVTLPGWRVRAGLPRRTPAGQLRVEDAPLRARSRTFRPGLRARALRVEVRGTGTVVLRAGGRATRARAGGRWLALRVPLRPGAGRVALDVTADPGEGALSVRALGVVERAPRR